MAKARYVAGNMKLSDTVKRSKIDYMYIYINSNQHALFVLVLTILKDYYSCAGKLKAGNIEFVMILTFCYIQNDKSSYIKLDCNNVTFYC